MKFFKKLGILALAASMALSVCSCGKDISSVKIEEPEGGVTYPETISIFCRNGGVMTEDMKDYNEIAAFKLLEEKTGTHIEWTIPTAVGFEEKFNMMIASGDYPDVIVADWNKKGIQQYVEDGVILDISDYVEKYMPNLYSFGKNNQDLAKGYIEDGGKMYSAPYIRQDKELNIYCGPVMRTDWLKKLGLAVPTTSDELYNVLKAFKTQDPNGNGKADEIPMGARGDATDLSLEALMHMFNTKNDFYVKDGKVCYGILEPEFDEGMAYVNKLFSEGLIDPDYVLLNRTELRAKVTNNITGFAFEFQPTDVMNTALASNPDFKFEGIPVFKAKDGVKRSMLPAYTQSIYDCSAAITSACQNPLGAMKWLDFLYGEEGHMIMNFGVEGDTYTMVDGIPTFTDKIQNNTSGLSRSQVWGTNFGTFSSYFPARQDWYSYSQYLSEYGKAAIETWTDGVVTDMNLPTLTFNSEDKEFLTTELTKIETYADEQFNKMVMGQVALSDLPKIREEVKKMGIDKVLEIYQKAYDLYENKDLGF